MYHGRVVGFFPFERGTGLTAVARERQRELGRCCREQQKLLRVVCFFHRGHCRSIFLAVIKHPSFFWLLTAAVRPTAKLVSSVTGNPYGWRAFLVLAYVTSRMDSLDIIPLVV